MHIIIIAPSAKLQILGTPVYVQEERKVHVALQEMTTSQWTSVSVCCLSYSCSVGSALLAGKQVATNLYTVDLVLALPQCPSPD